MRRPGNGGSWPRPTCRAAGANRRRVVGGRRGRLPRRLARQPALSPHPVRPGTAIPRRRHQHSLGRLAVTDAELEISVPQRVHGPPRGPLSGAQASPAHGWAGEGVHIFCVKAATRRLLAEHGVPSASSYLVEDVDQAVSVADLRAGECPCPEGSIRAAAACPRTGPMCRRYTSCTVRIDALGARAVGQWCALVIPPGECRPIHFTRSHSRRPGRVCSSHSRPGSCRLSATCATDRRRHATDRPGAASTRCGSGRGLYEEGVLVAAPADRPAPGAAFAPVCRRSGLRAL